MSICYLLLVSTGIQIYKTGFGFQIKNPAPWGRSRIKISFAVIECFAKRQSPGTAITAFRGLNLYCAKNYIIPPSGIAGAAGAGSGMSTIPHSVVKNIPATDAAFSRATRLTLVGSMTPASNMFTYSPVRAL